MPACAGKDAAGACLADEALCERIYACYTADELAQAGWPAEESACVVQLEDQDGCTEKTTANACVGNATYHGDQGSTCVTQISNLECSQVRDPNLDINAAAPACGKVCSVAQ